jgi:hypothetical protein
MTVDGKQRIAADINKFGWHVAGVFDPKEQSPRFA